MMTSDIEMNNARRMWWLVKRPMSEAFGEQEFIKNEKDVENLSIRLLFCLFHRASSGTLNEDGLRTMGQDFVARLVDNLSEFSNLPAKSLSKLTKDIEAILLLYPFNLLTGCQFYYLDTARPSLFISVDANDRPAQFDRTSFYRSYHISSDLPLDAYVLNDAESALTSNVDNRYLLEVTLPLNSDFWYVDQTMHRKKPTVKDYQYRMLIVDSYQEINRYDLHNLTDIKKLKLRGLFFPFPNSYSDNKMRLAQWHRQQTNPSYSQQALWSLLEIDELPNVRFPPYNRQ